MRTAIKTTLQFLGILIFALSIALDISALAGIIHIAFPPWVLSLIGFGLFAGYTYWTMHEKENHISMLENSKPLISAKFTLDEVKGLYYIDVTNSGETGEFEAQARVIDTTEAKLEFFWTRFNAYWEGEKSSRVRIPRGMSRLILLAKIEQGTPSSMIGRLVFYRMIQDSVDKIDTHSYVIGSESKTLVPEACLLVVISSTPRARNDEVILAIRLRADYKYASADLSTLKDRKPVDQITKEDFHKLISETTSVFSKS